MTIVKDIADAVRAADRKPIAMRLGHSGWHAYAADSAVIMGAQRDDLWDDLRLVRRLSFTRTDEFQGFDLILDCGPNPYAPTPLEAAA